MKGYTVTVKNRTRHICLFSNQKKTDVAYSHFSYDLLEQHPASCQDWLVLVLPNSLLRTFELSGLAFLQLRVVLCRFKAEILSHSDDG